MTDLLQPHLCIIGAGSAGLSLAAGAAMLGRDVVLIEKGKMGGDCLNSGCVPSKALLAAAKHAAVIRKAPAYGVTAGDPRVDYVAVMDHVQGVIDQIAPHDSQERFEGLGVTVLRDAARFTSPTEAVAGAVRIRAKVFVIATGSSPFIPPIPGLDTVPYLTNETLFLNRRQPRRLIIIGGGPIGVEMAQAHRRLGSEVAIIEGRTLLSADDSDAVEIIRRSLLAEGVELFEGALAARVDKAGDGIRVTLTTGAIVEGSHLLVAAGRKVNTEGLGLDAAGVAVDPRGITTDAALRTTQRRIYAIGDAAGGPQFTHLAGDHAATLVRRLFFKTPATRNDAMTPRVTYTDPELGAVGLSEAAARERFGAGVRVARFAYADNDRARAERRTEGFVKAITKANGQVLGAVAVGAQAGEVLTPWVMAVAQRRKIKDLTAFIAPYPTLSELTKRTAGAWYTEKVFSPAAKRLVSTLSIFD